MLIFNFLSVGEGNNSNTSRVPEIGVFEQSLDFCIEDDVDFRREYCYISLCCHKCFYHLCSTLVNYRRKTLTSLVIWAQSGFW